MIVLFPGDHEDTGHIDGSRANEESAVSMSIVTLGPMAGPRKENHPPPTLPITHHEIDHGLFGQSLHFRESLQDPMEPGCEDIGSIALEDEEAPRKSRGGGDQNSVTLDDSEMINPDLT